MFSLMKDALVFSNSKGEEREFWYSAYIKTFFLYGFSFGCCYLEAIIHTRHRKKEFERGIEQEFHANMWIMHSLILLRITLPYK